MTVTLRRVSDGSPVGAGDTFTDTRGVTWRVDNWSEGTLKVYAVPAYQRGKVRPYEFNPSELGLYIGHERGQPISSIKWGGRPAEVNEALRWILVEAIELSNARRPDLRPNEAAKEYRDIQAAIELAQPSHRAELRKLLGGERG